MNQFIYPFSSKYNDSQNIIITVDIACLKKKKGFFVYDNEEKVVDAR